MDALATHIKTFPSALREKAKSGQAESVVPSTQTAALVRKLGGPVEFDESYPVPQPGRNEVLAKVLYTGVCQSGMSHTYPAHTTKS